ncbi:ATP-binding domain-containing protein [Actinoplanes sp. NEAU-A12]|uniref:ATP-binding domain-containing protein n=1 Tax=Actinoplanes sandaracinus TaxID=3045177 RepID=A0ABT6WQJ4_9ACTN|nr:ATP-binding domain-containing protein [Actinoplanes sandaracinus]MDI6102018.1 ATP-binding domain-containing protein [Actinoplanes sandaracinus]
MRTDATQVLDLAHRLRSGTWDRAAVNGHSTRARGPVNPHDYDAIIVHKNADRWRLIQQMRGGSLPPTAGDEIMSLTNDSKAKVINGQPFKVLAQVGTATVPERLFHTKAGPRLREAYTYYVLDVESDGEARRLYAHTLGFGGRENEKLVAAMEPRRHNKRLVIPATFGRVLTAHKAQGSEWDRVLVVVDLDDLERVTGASKASQWLYTAVTRARRQVTIADLGQVSGLG